MAEATELEKREKKVFASERREDIFALILGFIWFILANLGIWKFGTLKSLVF